jgi:hypothetical protein
MYQTCTHIDEYEFRVDLQLDLQVSMQITLNRLVYDSLQEKIH